MMAFSVEWTQLRYKDFEQGYLNIYIYDEYLEFTMKREKTLTIMN